jgi:hypothetical protein
VNEILKKGGKKAMNKQENDNQTLIEDLPVNDAQQDEVKGGEDREGRTYYVGNANGGVWK